MYALHTHAHSIRHARLLMHCHSACTCTRPHSPPLPIAHSTHRISHAPPYTTAFHLNLWLVLARLARAGFYRLTRKSAAIVASKANELHGADESLDVRGLLEMESEAYRNNDAPNMASIYVRAAALSPPCCLTCRSPFGLDHSASTCSVVLRRETVNPPLPSMITRSGFGHCSQYPLRSCIRSSARVHCL